MAFRGEYYSECLIDEAVLHCSLFLLDLPIIKLDELANDSKHCDVGLEDFANSDESVGLPCSHTVGRTCLSKSVDLPGHADPLCPYCRQLMHEKIEICEPCQQNESGLAGQSSKEGLSRVKVLVQLFVHDRERFKIMAGYAIKAGSVAPLRFYLEYMKKNEDKREMPMTEAELERCKLYVLEKSLERRTDHTDP